jgi:hypothetical protein
MSATRRQTSRRSTSDSQRHIAGGKLDWVRLGYAVWGSVSFSPFSEVLTAVKMSMSVFWVVQP